MMRLTSLPPFYAVLGSVQEGIAGLGRVLQLVGLSSFFNPGMFEAEGGGTKLDVVAMSTLAQLKQLGLLHDRWPDHGWIRMDVVLHPTLTDDAGRPIGAHAEAILSMYAEEPWSIADVPPIFSIVERLYPEQTIERPDKVVVGRGLPSSIVIVNPATPLIRYDMSAPRLDVEATPAPLDDPPIEAPPEPEPPPPDPPPPEPPPPDPPPAEL